jgi:hypothetical protein
MGSFLLLTKINPSQVMKNKINNLLVFSLSIFILVTFLVPNITLATSGACSSHGGVNCSISNSYKSVVCNDGTSDSYTSYYDLQECKTSTICDNGQVTAFSASRGLSGSSFSQSASSNCESTNNSQNNIYIPTTQISSDSWKDEYCINTYGSNAIYNLSKDACRCIDGYMMDSSKVCLPEKEVLTKIYRKHLEEEVLIFMPKYKDIVDVNKIIDMALNKENSNKTFTQLIIEAYGDKSDKIKTENQQIEIESLKPIEEKRNAITLKKITQIDVQQKIIEPSISTSESNTIEIPTTEQKPETPKTSFIRAITSKTANLFKGLLSSVKNIFISID